MATIDEPNIATTMMMIKVAAETKGLLPVRVKLAPADMRHAVWRDLAIEYLERQEKAKAEKETLHLETPTLP